MHSRIWPGLGCHKIFVALLLLSGLTIIVSSDTSSAKKIAQQRNVHVLRDINNDDYYYDDDDEDDVYETDTSTDIREEYTEEVLDDSRFDQHYETADRVFDDHIDESDEDDHSSKTTSSKSEADFAATCQYEGQLLPVYVEDSQVCYKFKICIKRNNTVEEQIVVCPFGLEWKLGTYECQKEQESCRVDRLKERSSAWLNYLLSCPSTSSLSNAEQSEIHKWSYYLAMNKSHSKQLNRQEDFLTPIIMDLGIFRHVAGTCNAYFRCNYKEKSPFVHILSSAIYRHCDGNKIFNQDWNRCMSREEFEPYGRFKYTHPDPDQLCDGF